MSNNRNNGRRGSAANTSSKTTTVRKQKATRAASSQPNQPKTKQPNRSVPRPLVSRICGLTDPFCAHARGAKYPDESSIRTLPITYRTRATITADANGYVNLAFMPQVSYFAHTSASAYVGNDVTAWNNFTANTINSQIQSYRIVSAGFVLRRVSSNYTSSGMVCVRSFPATLTTSLTTVDTTTYNCSFQHDVSLTECKEIPVILQHNTTPAQTFYTASTDNTVFSGQTPRGYNVCTISVFGAPANTAVLDLEYIIHYECVFDDSSGMQQIATPSPPFVQAIKTAASNVTSKVAGYIGKTTEEVGRVVTKYAYDALLGYMTPEASLLALTL